MIRARGGHVAGQHPFVLEAYVTTADPQHARRGRVSEAWHRFRRWRQVRPFWGGLLTALAGVEIFGTTQLSLDGLSFQMGPTGFLSWLIPTILVSCGLLMWFSPQQRIFYAVVAAVTALFSLIGVNLGGFFVGLLLGVLGSALGFAWMPGAAPAPAAAPADPVTPTAPAPAAELTAPVGPVDSDGPIARVDSDGPVSPGDPAGDGPPPGGPGMRLLAVTLPLVILTGLVALAAPVPVRAAPVPVRAALIPVAAPACPTHPPAAPSSPAPPSGPDTTAPAGPSGSASASPTTNDRPRVTDVVGDLLDGIGRLFGRNDEDDKGQKRDEPAVTPSPSDPTTPVPSPTAMPDRPCGTPPASGGANPVDEGEPLPRIAADPGQPLVAAAPSKLTGSKVTMNALRFEGIVELPTAAGTLRTLKFRMDRAVTDDFLLLSPGPSGQTLRFATDRLTVRGDVSFYATRFVGRLLGIKITLTPDLPLPDGLPITSPIPITFTDPVMDLAFVTSDTLTARPKLRVDLA